MKQYHEQNYPVSIEVKVSFSGFTFEDEIKGPNEGHVLYLAKLNWPDAVDIKIIVDN